MQLTHSSLAMLLLSAVAAVPQPFPAPTPAPNLPPPLHRRQESPMTISSTTDSSATTPPILATDIQTGEFTAPNDGGVFGITSQSGYVQVAGHQLTAGGLDALVGGVRVTEASDGFVANGETIALMSVASSSVAATSTSDDGTSGTTSSAVSMPSAASAASSASSEADAVATAMPVKRAGAAIVGGVVGMLLL